MIRFFAAMVVGMFAMPASAALRTGADAPLFTTQAALAGKEFTYALAEELKNGPVVIFFYPKAFTRGCTIEAQNFAEKSEEFKALGATVIGISNDSMAVLSKFSTSACQSKFPVASDEGGKIIKAYESALLFSFANRTSFVIAPDGKVVFTYTSLSPDGHVPNTLDAVKKRRAASTPLKD